MNGACTTEIVESPSAIRWRTFDAAGREFSTYACFRQHAHDRFYLHIARTTGSPPTEPLFVEPCPRPDWSSRSAMVETDAKVTHP